MPHAPPARLTHPARPCSRPIPPQDARLRKAGLPGQQAGSPTASDASGELLAARSALLAAGAELAAVSEFRMDHRAGEALADTRCALASVSGAGDLIPGQAALAATVRCVCGGEVGKGAHGAPAGSAPTSRIA